MQCYKGSSVLWINFYVTNYTNYVTPTLKAAYNNGLQASSLSSIGLSQNTSNANLIKQLKLGTPLVNYLNTQCVTRSGYDLTGVSYDEKADSIAVTLHYISYKGQETSVTVNIKGYHKTFSWKLNKFDQAVLAFSGNNPVIDLSRATADTTFAKNIGLNNNSTLYNVKYSANLYYHLVDNLNIPDGYTLVQNTYYVREVGSITYTGTDGKTSTTKAFLISMKCTKSGSADQWVNIYVANYK